jgi:sulfur carrier protein
MHIILNGETREVALDCTVATLLEELDLTYGKRLAVEINKDIVARSEFAQRRLHAGDQVEIVHAIGGG